MSTKAIVASLGDETSAALRRVIEPYEGSREVTLAFGVWLIDFGERMLALWLPPGRIADILRKRADDLEKRAP